MFTPVCNVISSSPSVPSSITIKSQTNHRFRIRRSTAVTASSKHIDQSIAPVSIWNYSRPVFMFWLWLDLKVVVSYAWKDTLDLYSAGTSGNHNSPPISRPHVEESLLLSELFSSHGPYFVHHESNNSSMSSRRIASPFQFWPRSPQIQPLLLDRTWNFSHNHCCLSLTLQAISPRMILPKLNIKLNAATSWSTTLNSISHRLSCHEPFQSVLFFLSRQSRSGGILVHLQSICHVSQSVSYSENKECTYLPASLSLSFSLTATPWSLVVC